MVAAILAYLLLQAAFGSWRLAAMVFLSLPAGLLGGVLAAVAVDGVISLGSVAGLIAVFGLGVALAAAGASAKTTVPAARPF